MKTKLFLISLLTSFWISAQTKYDHSFEIGSGLQVSFGSYTISDFKLQEDKRILVGGNFNSYNNVTAGNFMRLMQNGSIDATFNSGTGFNNKVKTIAIQQDGKILVGGDFSSYNGISSNKIIRLNYDGTVDYSFNIGTGVNIGNVEKILIDANGKILVAGTISEYNGVTTYNIIRLLPNGTLDTTFNSSGTGADGNISNAIIQPDNKIIIVGLFNSYNGVTKNSVARLNADGTLDTTFNTATNPGTTSGSVASVALQSTGKVIIGGYFTTYQDNPVSYLARLTADGNYDSSFGFIGPNNVIQKVEVLQNDKIMVGGNFTTFDGNPNSKFIFLNSNGSESGIPFGTGFNGSNVSAIAFDEVTQNIYVGGYFTNYDGYSPVRGICRLHLYETLPIPDSAFEQKLISLGIDTNGTTGDVLYTDITNITTLDVSNSSISDLTGIQGFIKLQDFFAYNNSLTNVDLRYNPVLNNLDLSVNNLTQISTRNSPILENLDASYNVLTGINVTENPTLIDLRLNNNQLSSLDISSNTSLENLRATNNLISDLYLASNPNLIFVNIINNSLLNTIDIRNGFNPSLGSFDATNCNSLTCIYVDYASSSFLSSWNKDATSTFVNNETECATLSSSSFANNNFALYPNPVHDYLTIEIGNSNISKSEIFDLAGKKIIESKSNILNVNHLENGIYMVKITAENGTVTTQKIIKN